MRSGHTNDFNRLQDESKITMNDYHMLQNNVQRDTGQMNDSAYLQGTERTMSPKCPGNVP